MTTPGAPGTTGRGRSGAEGGDGAEGRKVEEAPPERAGRPLRERMADLLARRMAAAEHAPGETISVAELRRELLPYPLCRESLDLASKAEYDLAFLELLGDSAHLEIDDPELARAVEEELSGPEPGLAFLREFTPTPLRPSIAAGARSRMRAEAEGRGPDRAEAGDPEAADAAADPDPADAAFLSELSDETPKEDPAPFRSSVTCGSCGRSLPERLDARFCPHCGSDQRSPRCEGCDADLEPGWAYCPSCGRRVDGSGPA